MTCLQFLFCPGYVRQQNISTFSLPLPNAVTFPTHSTCNMSFSPFILGLKAIMYNTAKSVADSAFNLLDFRTKSSRPLPSLQIRAPCPPLVPLWTFSLNFMRHFYVVHYPSGCPPGPVYTVPQPTVHTWCGVLFKGESYGFPSVTGQLVIFPLGEKLWAFPKADPIVIPLGGGLRVPSTNGSNPRTFVI